MSDMVNPAEADHWYKACTVDEIKANALQEVEINGISIAIANLGEDQYRAFPPLCPHMAEPLTESAICNNGIMTCSKHLWQWELQTGTEQGPAEKPLLFYEIAISDGFLWVRAEHELVYDYDMDDDDDFEW